MILAAVSRDSWPLVKPLTGGRHGVKQGANTEEGSSEPSDELGGVGRQD